MESSDRLIQGKVCLVTGATSGIGAVTAGALARHGANLVLVGRDPGKCAAAVSRLQAETGNQSVDALIGDLSSQQDVRRIAREFRERQARLDVLVNNAGGIFLKRRESVDGIEMTLALNHLAYYLLTRQLLDRLLASPAARVINVSSGAHWRALLNFDDLQSKKAYRGFQVYSESKLANLLFTYELARRMQGTRITVNALHPGVVATNIGRNNAWRGWLIGLFFKLRGISPEEGADTGLYLATSSEVQGVTGKYFVKRTAKSSSPASYDQASAARLWDVSAALTGLPNSP
jgi:NAD(P)-dependent dehydrogenase (short-subunit alcohol dehydrogenase family)